MTKLSDLPEDLVAEIFSRVPITSFIPVRSTCKQWNSLTKKLVLGTRAASRNKQPFQEFVGSDSKLCSLKFNLQGIRNEKEAFIDPTTEQVSVFDKFKVKQVTHCDGLLLLCITNEQDNNNPRVMVWNPCSGQVRWIKPVTKFHKHDQYALGFYKNNNHKILRFDYEFDRRVDLYDFSSASWSVVDIRPDSTNLIFHSKVSLKGNTYFLEREITTVETEEANNNSDIYTIDYLFGFDFTRERFGPRLPLPFNPSCPTYMTFPLSSVRDEKLSVLYQHPPTFEIMEIWVSTEIEPNAVSWSRFLRVDLSLINGSPDGYEARSFFIDEEKKVVVRFDCRYRSPMRTCIIGEDGYFKSVPIHLSNYGYLHVCSPYVPSLVQL